MSLGQDYGIQLAHRLNSDVLIIAPHGGKIERGTSELARAIAGDDMSFYAFEGLRACDNRILHITSHRFDEPSALKLAGHANKIVGIHGRKDDQDIESTYLGGLDCQLVRAIEHALLRSGFSAQSTGHSFPASNPRNICNRGRSGTGAQLELPLELRKRLLESKDRMNRFSVAVRNALVC